MDKKRLIEEKCCPIKVKSADALCYSAQKRAILNTTDYLIPSFQRFLKGKQNYSGGDVKRWDVVQNFFSSVFKKGVACIVRFN